VVDQAMNKLSGATVTVTSKKGQSYSVIYEGGGAETSATGKFYIPNVVSGDVVKIVVTLPGYTFTDTYMDSFAPSVTAKYIRGAVVKGDLNSDGVVNLADAILALKFFAGENPGGIRANYATSGADVNGDNVLGIEELIFIMQTIAGLR